MSGRLVILPKKSYCPWNRDNVERVLRDEKRLERLTTTTRQVVVSTRIEQLAIVLRGSNTGKNDVSSLPLAQQQQHEHVNLFRQEEESCRNAILQSSVKDREHQTGISPVQVLGQSKLETRGDNRPFYLRTGALEEKLLSPREERRKESLDPMKDFYKDKSSKFKVKVKNHLESHGDLATARRPKHESKRRRSSKHDKSGRRFVVKQSKHYRDNIDIESLRQRRLEREAIESKRAADAASSSLSSSKQDDDYDCWKNDRKRSYHNQYNPGLSRTLNSSI